MDIKRRLNAQVYDANKEIAKLRAQYNESTGNRWEWHQKLDQAICDRYTAELLLSIYTVTPENSMVEPLNRYSKTTDILDRYSKSEKPFLIFPRAFMLGKHMHTVSLVVRWVYGEVNYQHSGLMISYLKTQIKGAYVPTIPPDIPHTYRIYDLMMKVYHVGLQPLQKGDIIPFEQPCYLGGQTSDDQWGFGNSRHGEPRKQYGAHSNYAIIGIIVED